MRVDIGHTAEGIDTEGIVGIVEDIVGVVG